MADKDYEGPVSHETPGIAPDSGKQTPEQYIAARFGAVPQEARAAMGFHGNPEMYMHIELMFRSCYWKERHDLLEQYVQLMARQVLAARAAVFGLIKHANPSWPTIEIRMHADGHIDEELAKLPQDAWKGMEIPR